MNIARRIRAWILCLMIPLCCAGRAAAQSLVEPSSINPSDPTELLRARLEQQDAELRDLRSQLGELQTAMQRIGSAPSTIPTQLQEESRSISVDQVTFELSQRLDSVEQRLKQQTIPAALDAADHNDSSSPKGYEVGTDKSLMASWNNGPELKSKNGDFRIHFGTLVQYDINWLNTADSLQVSPAIGGIGPNPDSTQIRRARLIMDGTFYEVFGFKFEFDLANDLTPAVPSAGQPVATSPALTELWVQWMQIPAIGTIRAGNQKEALGLEHVEAIRDLSFLEPSYLFDMLWGPFNAGFNPGVSFYNTNQEKSLTWQFGVWGNNSDPFAYSIGNDWAFTGRTSYLLFYDEPSNGRYLWEVGLAGSTRKPDEDLVRLRDRGDIRSGPPGTLNPLYGDTGAMHADQQNIVALETFAQFGALSIQGEYAGTWVVDAFQPFTPPASAVFRGTPFFQGGYIEALYFLTGDSRLFNKQFGVPGGVNPLENAFWVRNGAGNCCYGLGAWQIGARYNAIDLNDNGINGGILNSFTFGVNWFPTPNAKFQFNYDFTSRSQVKQVAAGDINSFGTRFQYSF